MDGWEYDRVADAIEQSFQNADVSRTGKLVQAITRTYPHLGLSYFTLARIVRIEMKYKVSQGQAIRIAPGKYKRV